jgi:hypothetical protein
LHSSVTDVAGIFTISSRFIDLLQISYEPFPYNDARTSCNS